ncbi:MAG: hypothetical protein FJ399_21525 [Verrucomicrobia bacterium]|nr:hypothetical protein [Verrucomicrobiota bacterium]
MIRLRDRAEGFSSDSNPKPLLRIFGTARPDQPGNSPVTVLFNSGIRGVELDLGSGNAGAVGIEFDSAQDCFVEDVRILAREGCAGMRGLPGRGATTGNCEIIGGRYGIDTKTVDPMLVGLFLRSQSVAALRIGASRGTSIVGVEIEDCRGSGIETVGAGSHEQGNLSIVDLSISLAPGNPAPAILNRAQRALQLRDVYVRGARKLVDCSGDQDLAGKGDGWVRLIRYHYVPALLNGVRALHLIDGREVAGAVVQTTEGEAPTELRRRHIWARTPSCEDPGVVVIWPLPGEADNRVAIQQAIDSNRVVQLAAGRYPVSGPIVLRHRTVLMGVPGLKSVLVPTWRPSRYEWCIDTEDAAEADTYLLDLAVDTPDGSDYLGGMRWRVGRNSVARRFRCFLRAGHAETNFHNYEITGNGGGRWYGFHDHASVRRNSGPPHPLYRKVFLAHTTGQPITFYGLNLERGGAQRGDRQHPFFEAIGASNIRSFGSKVETEGPVFRFERCENVLVSTCVSHTSIPKGAPLLEFQDCRRLEVHNVYLGAKATIATLDPVPMLVDRTQAVSVPQGVYLGCFHSGEIDLDVWR